MQNEPSDNEDTDSLSGALDPGPGEAGGGAERLRALAPEPDIGSPKTRRPTESTGAP